jgi:hypothetical protein
MARVSWSSRSVIAMSWEAHRWTAKTPSELFHVFGPHGVDSLVREAMNACWRQLPDDDRTFAAVRRAADEVVRRNLAVWRAIKKPTPEAFFDHLAPHNADQFLRQAMVLCWMMLPRAGGRDLSDVTKVISAVYERLMGAWAEDNNTFTKGPSAKKRVKAKATAKPKKAVGRPKAKPRRKAARA